MIRLRAIEVTEDGIIEITQDQVEDFISCRCGNITWFCPWCGRFGSVTEGHFSTTLVERMRAHRWCRCKKIFDEGITLEEAIKNYKKNGGKKNGFILRRRII